MATVRPSPGGCGLRPARGLVGSAELRLAADGLRGAGRAKIRQVAHAADPRSESALESCLRAVVIGAGVRDFVPQVVIRGDGFRARVDLADERRCLVAEAESFEHHGHRAALARDCERYDELVSRGWRVLRLAWEQVMFQQPWVESILHAVAGQPAGRPSGGQKSLLVAGRPA